MTLRSYFLVSVAVFALVVYAAHYFDAPILPFALILLAGETILGLQVEDHRVSKFMSELFRAPKHLH